MIQRRSAPDLPKPKYSVIIPAYNEERRIEKTLSDFTDRFSDSELIVVLNGCKDDTKGVVAKFRSTHPNVHMVEIPDAIGKGGAVRAGFLLARADLVGYVDADGSTPAAEMRRLFDAIGDYDGIIGSRWMPGSHVEIEQPLRRRIASRCFNSLVRLFFGLRYADTQCGAKVFRAESLRKVMGHMETSNLAFDVDLLFAMRKAGFRVAEEPTHWIDAHGSSIALVSASLRMLAALLRLRLGNSALRLVVPLFDRWFPTAPVVLHDRLRILLLNWRDPKHPQAGGAEMFLFEQAKHWIAWGHEVECITAGFPGAPERENVNGVQVRRVGNAATVYAAVPWTYVRECRDRFDVLIDAENGIPFFSPLFSLKPKVCVMHHVHREVFRKHLPWYLARPLIWCEEKLMPFIYRNTIFVAVSEDTRDEMRRLGMSKRHIGLVYNGVDSSLEPSGKDTRPTVIYLGRLKRYKRVDHLIREFVTVLEHLPEARLEIAGDGDALPSLRALVAELGIEDAVTFHGYVDDECKRKLLQRAWVFVNPSEMEGWGISVIEANACATPAISYDVPGLREAIVDGVSGLLVPDSEALSTSIIRVLSDEKLREKLAFGAVSRAGAFSWESSARNMLNELMRAIVGSEIKSVDLDEDWTLVGGHARRAMPAYRLSSRMMLRPPESEQSPLSVLPR